MIGVDIKLTTIIRYRHKTLSMYRVIEVWCPLRLYLDIASCCNESVVLFEYTQKQLEVK